MKTIFLSIIIFLGATNTAFAAERYMSCENASSQFSFTTPTLFKAFEDRGDSLNIRRFVFDRVNNKVVQAVVTFNGSDYYLNDESLQANCVTVSGRAKCKFTNLPQGLESLSVFPQDHTNADGSLDSTVYFRALTNKSESPTDAMINVTPFGTDKNCTYKSNFEQG